MYRLSAKVVRIRRSSAETNRSKVHLCRWLYRVLLAAVTISTLAIGRDLGPPEFSGMVVPIQLQHRSSGPDPLFAEASNLAWMPLSALWGGKALTSEPVPTGVIPEPPRRRFLPALGLVCGLFSLTGISILALSRLRERTWKQIRSEARKQVARDLALLDASIRAEMKQYESLSRLERRA